MEMRLHTQEPIMFARNNENAVTRIFRATASDGFVKA